MLQNSNCFKDKEVLTTPLWYKSSFQLQFNCQWHNKSIIAIGNLLDIFHNILHHDSINETYNKNMHFWNTIASKSKEFIEFRDKPETTESFPRNNSIKIL